MTNQLHECHWCAREQEFVQAAHVVESSNVNNLLELLANSHAKEKEAEDGHNGEEGALDDAVELGLAKRVKTVDRHTVHFEPEAHKE